METRRIGDWLNGKGIVEGDVRWNPFLKILSRVSSDFEEGQLDTIVDVMVDVWARASEPVDVDDALDTKRKVSSEHP